MPSETDRRSLLAGDVRLSLVDRGSGLPVLLTHGFPLNHAMWNAQIDVLARQYRVIAPDLRGFGDSDVTDGVVTMQQMADDLAALLDALQVDRPVVLCGLSMGGYVALAFVQKYAARLAGLVLCDTRAAADAPEAIAGRRVMAERALAEGPDFLVDAMRPKLFAAETLREHPQTVDSFEQMILATDPRGIAAASLGMGRRPDSTDRLAEVRCPTLVVVGSEDPLSPPQEMQAMAAAIDRAQFVEIPGAGHMSPMERPAEFNAALLEFLGSL